MSGIEEMADRLRGLKYDYDSMSTSLEDAIDDIADDVEELQDENARLRESVQNAEYEESVAWDRARSAERRNDKLRELVRRLYNMADFCRNCPDTERCDVDVEWLGCTVADPIDKLMDELGVEI